MQQNERNYFDTLVFHLLGLLVVLVIIGAFSDSLSPDSDAREINHVFLLLAMTGLGHFVMAFRRRVSAVSMLGFFLADLPIVFVLVKSTGASASPFLVMYPLLSLAGAISFVPRFSVVYLGVVLLFQAFSVGFGPSIVGNALATIATSVLGIYLVKALERSDRALSISEVQRRRLENLQRAILANIPSGLISVDSQGRVIQINSVGLKILGLSESEVLFNKLNLLMPSLGEQLYKLNTLVPAISQMNYERDRSTISYQTKNGEQLRLGFSIARLSDPSDNSVLGSLVVFQDLTQIILMEETLRMSEKLAAVGKLAAGIAHEIRNPLAGISGSAQLLTGSDSLDEEDKKLLNIIQRESTRLDSLITEFLEYVRPAKARMEPIDVVQICENVVDGIKVSSKWRGLKCQVEIKNMADGPVLMSGDANKLTQVLMNLVLNAGQAKSTRVEIRIEPQTSSIEIRDNGAGISSEHQKRLFEPFFTTKESGTGLGLATCYRVLQAMEAKIEMQSPLPDFAPSGGGTLFRLRLKALSSQSDKQYSSAS